jgi:hypothetical protein
LKQKEFQSFQISNRDGSTVQRTFIDFERLYDNVKTILPQNLDKPPKKKLLLAEAKLAEKRKTWVENFSTYLIGRHPDKLEFLRFTKEDLYILVMRFKAFLDP